MKRGMPEIVEYPIERAERLASIMGESSAAADALRELKRRRAVGEDVRLFVRGSMIFVGPPVKE